MDKARGAASAKGEDRRAQSVAAASGCGLMEGAGTATVFLEDPEAGRDVVGDGFGG